MTGPKERTVVWERLGKRQEKDRENIYSPYLQLCKLVRFAASIFSIDKFGKQELPELCVLEREK